ncbi:MAG: hypothetical protein HZA22_12290 [Nitrospirae bacterium]|nr:hypothetical protein [Nitrospirota bacterium]MBI5694825.1 hypothetical protein [Nitrospirota bacterium]
MIVHHSIRVRASAKEIYPMLLEWGMGDWWPEGSRLRCVGFSQAREVVGTRYRCGISGLLGFSWDAEVVSSSAGREISRKLSGALEGVERLYLIPGRDTCEVHVLSDFRLGSGVKGFIWNLALARAHESAVRDALAALRWRIEGTEDGDGTDMQQSDPMDSDRRRFLKSLIRR